jgi:putative nucleotidyltransferase with HDIG domain
MDKVKLWIRDFLIGLAKNFDNQNNGPVLRDAKHFFQAEVKVPIVLSIILTFIIVYFMLLIELGFFYRNYFAVGILTVVISYIFIMETRKEENLVSDNDAAVLMCLTFVIALLCLQICQHYLSIFVFPISAFVIMGVMLLAPRIGLAFAITLSLLAGFLSGMRFDVFVLLLASGAVVLSMAKNIRRRSDFITVSLAATAVNILMITMFYLINLYSFFQFKTNVYFGILNGLFAMVILLVLIPIFERIFSRPTNIKLIELADFNNPLLKELMLKAPGTYHHVIMTAAVAEQAARVIGANSILARVASYYHDIGKLKNPEYFIENQNVLNPHDGLSSAMSMLILTSHIKDGAALADKYNLDKDIINCLMQHHGTTVMNSFYHKACEANGGEEDLDIDAFRYPGPKPQTKLAAILMIADSCEAACRAIDEPTNANITEMVEKVVNDKTNDEQFCECDITLKELQLIKESAMSTLIRMYHSRIKYEDTDKDSQKESQHAQSTN